MRLVLYDWLPAKRECTIADPRKIQCRLPLVLWEGLAHTAWCNTVPRVGYIVTLGDDTSQSQCSRDERIDVDC